jgi:hypothetical protein
MVLQGFNDLNTTHPQVAAQWHPTKNGDTTPRDITAGSGKKAWWLCPVGPDHEWEATISSRTAPAKQSGCAVCAGRKVAHSTSLAALYPAVAAEWHPTRNSDKTPQEVTPYVTRRVWWQCRRQHEWFASIASRTRGGTGCPSCAGRVAIPGESDLATTHPHLVTEWHPTKNGEKNPHNTKAGSNAAIWWQCSESHEWKATPNNRTVMTSGCPYCAGQRPIPGVNDLATTHPHLAAQWHPTKNGTLKPVHIMGGTDRKVWWVCHLNHEWSAPPFNRIKGVGCPVCANKKVQSGFNDLATTNPSLAAEWHPTKNGNTTSRDVTEGSGKKYWWICDEGHAWSSTVSNRSWGQGCPTCARTGFNPSKEGWLYFLRHQQWNMLQIGISNVIEARLARHQQSGWEVIEVRGPMPGDLIAQLEKAALQALRKRGAQLGRRGDSSTFDGHTESWTAESLCPTSISQIIEWVYEDDLTL